MSFKVRGKKSKLTRILERAYIVLASEPKSEKEALVYEARALQDKIIDLFIDEGRVIGEDMDRLSRLLGEIVYIKGTESRKKLMGDIIKRSERYKQDVEKFQIVYKNDPKGLEHVMFLLNGSGGQDYVIE